MLHPHLIQICLVILCRESRYFEDISKLWIFRLRTFYNFFQVWASASFAARQVLYSLSWSMKMSFLFTMFHLTHFSNKKSMLNFLQTCLVLSRHPLALTDCHVDPHHQLDNFLLLDQTSIREEIDQASPAYCSHSRREQREGAWQGRHSILKMSTSIFQFKFSKFENQGGGCDDHKLSGMSKSTNKGRVQKKISRKFH